MRHFYRTQVKPDQVVSVADDFFPTIGLTKSAEGPRSRSFSGELGSLTMTVKMEGGHYTFVEVHTDQMGESRLDRNVKQFFVRVNRLNNPKRKLEASY